jgi:phosphate transport system substrate-binding protein
VSVRRITTISQTLGALAVGVCVLPASAGAATSLSGAGSGLVAPLVAEWSVAYQTFHGTLVSYSPVGSQAGITDISSRTIDFAGSDAPMTAAQWNACNGCYQIPWALSAVAIGYHVGGLGRKLYLTGNVLAQIYLGQISRWNDARIKALNPRASLPNLRITPIYANGSGATYAFTRYLSKLSASWRRTIGYGLTVSFPTGVAANSTSAASALLVSTNGTIAYVGAAYLFANKLPAAAIENAAGRFEYPNLSEIESAGRTVNSVPVSNALQIVDPPSSARIAYPIATYSYVIVAGNAARKSDLTQWLSYIFGNGQQFGPSLDFAPLPANVLRASKATLSAFAGSR